MEILSYSMKWLELTLRWGHVLFAILWVGNSFLFNYLDNKLTKNISSRDVDAEGYLMHSGYYYKLTRLKSSPPVNYLRSLVIFKWQSYLTFITGVLLLAVIYYYRPEILMVDKKVLNMLPSTAIILSILSLVASWLIYDYLCKTNLVNNTILFSIICLIIAIIISYLLTKIYGSRAAYIHVGASLGTIMAANVFRVIIPSQKNMVDAALANKEPDLKKGLSAKTRSIHNNYLTLPVLFIMISAHFPFTYGHKYNWLILAIISIIGASVRHYFNLRNKKQYNVWILPMATIGMISLMLYVSIPKINVIKQDININEEITFSEIENIINYRCTVCHASKPTFEGFEDPPLGIIFDKPADIIKNINKIKAQVIDSDIMPPANLTGMTVSERNKIKLWINLGANINN